MTKYLILPGYKGSDILHWQSIWQNHHLHNSERLLLADYTKTDKENWTLPLLKKLSESEDQFIVIAHSLGCLAFIHTYSRYVVSNVKAALLVAPPDVEQNENAWFLKEFAPVPEFTLDIPSLVVASNNDHYCPAGRAAVFAEKWGSRFINIGDWGHINSISGLGHWRQGLDFLDSLTNSQHRLVA